MTGDTTMRFAVGHVGDVDLHYATLGPDDGPIIIFLHGFPEFWIGWRSVLPFLADKYRCIVPDQRGYHLSSRPQDVSAYAVHQLVEDVRGLADLLSPQRKFYLAGHDWGASIAYMCAVMLPERIEKLIVVNGVHPGPFQRALLHDVDQIRASQYFHLLRAPDAEDRLKTDNFAGLWALFKTFSSAGFLTPELREEYEAAWRTPGTLTGMLNWYRASRIYVPRLDETPDVEKAIAVPSDRFRISMPHLLIYGQEDRCLLPICCKGLEVYAPSLEHLPVAGVGHWILHERPHLVANAIREFCG